MPRKSTQIVRKVFDRSIMPEEIIESIKEEIPDIKPIQEQFFADMLKLLQTPKRKGGKVIAIPAPCGIGKSIFIKHYIKLCAKNKLGLIVITDNIERLDKQYDLPKEAKEQIFMCRMETSVIGEKQEIFSHPVIMMTSQKFFGLSDEARELLYRYDKKTAMYKYRRRVIIDEQPIFYIPANIDIAMLNDIDTLLNDGLDETIEDKKNIISTYQKCRAELSDYIKELETKFENDITFYVSSNQFENHGKESFMKFYELIDRYMVTLKEFNVTNAKNIEFLKQLYTDGGIFISTKKRGGYKYKKGFWLFKSCLECFQVKNGITNFYIFDGTADVYPLYEQDFIQIYDCDKYRKELDLSINFVKISTSKSRFNEHKEELTAINDFIQKSKQTDMPLIMTYANYINSFKDTSKALAYFGNIKGFNEFKELTECYHIGINRYEPIVYFMMACVVEPWIYQYVKTMNIDESAEFFEEITNNKIDYSEVSEEMKIKMVMQDMLTWSVMADFEQNIFRLSIRDIGNKRHNEVNLLINYENKQYEILCRTIEARFSKRAEINYVDTPSNILEEKTRHRKSDTGETHPQKILNYIDSLPDGCEFNIQSLCDVTGLSTRQVESAKKNSIVREKLNDMRTSKRGNYKK